MIRTYGTNLFGLKEPDKEAFCTALQQVFTPQLGSGQIFSYEIPSYVDEYIEEYELLNQTLDARNPKDLIKLNILREEEDRLLSVTETYEMCDRVFLFVIKDSSIQTLNQRANLIIQTFGNYQKTELLSSQEMIKILYAYYNPASNYINDPDPNVCDITRYIIPERLSMIDNPIHRTMVIGEKYARFMYGVVIKSTPQFAMWCYLAARRAVEFSMHFQPAETDIIEKQLNKSIKNIQKNLNHAKDPSVQAKLEKDKSNLEQMVDSQVNTMDMPLYILVTIRVSAFSEPELNQLCNDIKKDMAKFGISMRAGFFETDKLFHATAPICYNPLPHYMMTTTNDTLGFNYPFVFESLYDHQKRYPKTKTFNSKKTSNHYYSENIENHNAPPIYLGNTVDTNGPVFYSNFKLAPDRTAHNEFIAGITGSGKTTLLMYLIRHRHSIGIKQYIIDVEGKELNKLTHSLGGVNYNCADNSRGMINILELRFQIPDDEKEVEKSTKISLDELKPLTEHMRFVRSVLNIYKGNSQEIQLLEMTEIEKCLTELYENMGINYETSARKIVENYTSNDYPTFRDLYEALEKKYENELKKEGYINKEKLIRIEKAIAFIYPMAVGTDASVFNGHTSFDLSSDLICFNLSQLHDNTDSQILQTQYFNVMSFIWTTVVSNSGDTWQQIYADEANVIFDERYYAIMKFFENIVRRDRKQHCALTTATQQPEDMLKDSVVEQGKAIITQSPYQFYFGLGDQAISYFKGKNLIPESEETWIQYAKQGQCYAKFGNQTAMRINIMIPEETLNAFEKMKP